LTQERVVPCDAELVFDTPNFLDNCSEVELTFSDDVLVDDCEQTYTRIWTAQDACGNASTTVQRIIATDNEAPVFVGTVEDLEMTYDEFVKWEAPAQLEAEDNCSELTQVITSIENQDCENYVVTYNSI
jgi:hypothetical protein